MPGCSPSLICAFEQLWRCGVFVMAVGKKAAFNETLVGWALLPVTSSSSSLSISGRSAQATGRLVIVLDLCVTPTIVQCAAKVTNSPQVLFGKRRRRVLQLITITSTSTAALSTSSARFLRAQRILNGVDGHSCPSPVWGFTHVRHRNIGFPFTRVRAEFLPRATRARVPKLRA